MKDKEVVLKLNFIPFGDKKPRFSKKYNEFIPCLVLINCNKIEYAFYQISKSWFFCPYYKKVLVGVTHFHQIKYREEQHSAQEEIDTLKECMDLARERILWVKDTLDPNSDERQYLRSAYDYLIYE